MSTPTDVDVFVVGAGPTGLAAANEAARRGLSVHIIDRKPHRSTHSKALVVHARTLEVFEAMGLADTVRAAGAPFKAMEVQPGDGAAPVRIDLMHLDWGDTRYPYWLSIPQFETERCLEEHLIGQGVCVDWGTTFTSLVQRADRVEVTTTTAAGKLRTWRAKWLLGCDGGRSHVRAQASIDFEQDSIGETFVIADALGTTPMPGDVGTTSLSPDGVIFLVPMPERGRWRIIAHMPDHAEGERFDIDAAFINRLIADRLGFAFGARDLSWTSQFVLKQGVAQRYRSGRVFIAGDAAHLHSPVGGQGLNTGVQDAHALLWRIALAERAAPEHGALLDSYEAERRPVAVSMVKNTTRATKLITLHSGIIARLRAFVARHALQTERVQNQLGRPIGMLELAYKDSPVVVAGVHGTAGPGDRLPNPGRGPRRLHDLLDPLRHTVLLLDSHGAALAGDLRRSGMACIEIGETPGSGDFIDTDGALRAALGGALLLVVRPDRIIAVATDSTSPAAIHDYARNVLGISPQDL